MKKVFNELSGVELEVRFTAADDGPSIPETVHWRLDCATTGQSLQEWTEETPVVVMDDLCTSVAKCYVEIEIAGSLNVIQNDRNSREDKVLMVVADKDGDREFSQTLVYSIKNTRQRV
jgi:hypothetical protein